MYAGLYSHHKTNNAGCHEMQVLRNVISGGEPSVLLHNEASHFPTKEEKRSMIKDAGIVDIGPGEGRQVVGKIINQR